MKKPTPSKEREKFFEIANDAAADYWKYQELKRDLDNAQKEFSQLHSDLQTKYSISIGTTTGMLDAIKAKIADAFIGEGK